MSALGGAGVGAGLAVGVVVAACSAPPLRPIRLADRMAPYLPDASVPGRYPRRSGRAFGAARSVVEPVLARIARRIDGVLGGAGSIRRRLGALGSDQAVDDYRLEQVLWGAIGMALGAAVAVLVCVVTGRLDPLRIAALAVAGAAAGVVARDRALSATVRRREQVILAELPVVADLVALAVMAGESLAEAVTRVCRITRGEVARDLERALAQARTGTALPRALHDLAERSSVDAFIRFVHGLAVALERGTPLADVLRAQAADVREAGTRALLAAGGRKEIAMMVPIVFLILPITVVFALYPGLLTLTSLAHG